MLGALKKTFCCTLFRGALVFAIGGCATNLRKATDIRATPEDFAQIFDEAPPALASSSNILGEPNSKSLERLLQRVPKKGETASFKKGLNSKAKVKGPKIKDTGSASSVLAPPETWVPPRWPFSVGEKISMVIRYGPLEGGLAVLEVMEPKLINGAPVLHYQGRVKSSKVLELFYKIDDVIDSWVDMNSHLPLRQEIQQLESGRWGRRVVLFDQAASKAKFYANTDFKDGRKEEIRREDPMTPFAQDVFGALFFYRFAAEPTRISFPIHDRFRNWSNELTFLGREKIKVPAGEFNTIRFKMFPRVSGQLEPKGDVEIWVKDDPSRVMVQFKAKIKVGSLTGELSEYVPGLIPLGAPPVMKTPINLKTESL